MQALNIHLIAPSGYPPDPAVIERALQRLRAAGHMVGNEACVARCAQRFAGSDEERIAELNALADLPDGIDLVLAVRGGYGLSRMLPRLDLARIAARILGSGVRLMGHSDFTALQLALLAHGAPSFAGPMLAYDFGAEQPSAFTQQDFAAMISGQARGRALRVAAPDMAFDPQASRLPEAGVSGTLWGGNLAMVCSLLGTPWMPAIDGGILFVEDINEHPYRIERMLLQLLHSGVLGRQRALLLGDFSGYRLSDFDNGYDFAAMLRWFRAECPIPVLSGLPFGHCPDKLTLPVGGVATVAPAEDGWTLTRA